MGIKEREESYLTVGLLKKELETLSKIETDQEWWEWHSNMLGILERIYTKKSNRYEHFNLNCGSNNAPKILQSIIDEISHMGLPTSKQGGQKSTFNFENKIHNENNNSQVQNIDININVIFETIKDELPPVKLREIQEIVNSEEPKESKLNKIGETLKNIGVEVVSSTLAKVIGKTMGVE